MTLTYQDVLNMALNKEIIIVDVRSKDEFQSGHIKGAIHCDVETISTLASKVLKDKDQHYFVYCQSGYRSTVALGALKNLGYKKVDNLGGISSWPYPLEY
jgi:phage shock protein E